MFLRHAVPVAREDGGNGGHLPACHRPQWRARGASSPLSPPQAIAIEGLAASRFRSARKRSPAAFSSERGCRRCSPDLLRRRTQHLGGKPCALTAIFSASGSSISLPGAMRRSAAIRRRNMLVGVCVVDRQQTICCGVTAARRPYLSPLNAKPYRLRVPHIRVPDITLFASVGQRITVPLSRCAAAAGTDIRQTGTEVFAQRGSRSTIKVTLPSPWSGRDPCRGPAVLFPVSYLVPMGNIIKSAQR